MMKNKPISKGVHTGARFHYKVKANNQWGFYGQLISRLTPSHSPNFEVRVLLPVNAG